jgi:diacylglycerol kinase (ATP)
MDQLKKYKKYNIISSFKHAVEGVLFALKTEFNIKIQLFIGLFLVVFNVYQSSWFFIFLHLIFMLFVISQEVMNTTIEYLCDLISLEHNHNIKKIKDLSAGSVLLMSISWGLVIAVNLLNLFIKIW